MGGRTEHAFAVIPPGLEPVLVAELRELGLSAEAVEGGALFPSQGDALLRAVLGARTPARVWLRVASFRATTLDDLARRAREAAWSRFVSPRQPVQARVSAARSRLRHRDTVGKKVELAVQDALRGPRRASAGRPSRDPVDVLVRIVDDVVELSVDASGDAHWRRGWRRDIGEAPLRENLAAAVLRLVGWRPGEALVDPMCGSGTFPIEAATIASGRPVGAGRRFALERWPEHDPATLRRVLAGLQRPPTATSLLGADRDEAVLRAARANADRAGVRVSFVHRAVAELAPLGAPGLVVANPPWGERIRGADDAWRDLGDALRARFAGWRVALLVPDRRFLKLAGLDLRRVGGFSSGGVRLAVHAGPVGG